MVDPTPIYTIDYLDELIGINAYDGMYYRYAYVIEYAGAESTALYVQLRSRSYETLADFEPGDTVNVDLIPEAYRTMDEVDNIHFSAEFY